MDTARQITIGLPDGRRLGAALFGPAGMPWLFFHGLGGSRLSPGWMFPAAQLHQAGVQLIALDRPGFGLSPAGQGLVLPGTPVTPPLSRTSLGSTGFGVLGVSMGAAPA
jgi:pimeloyl-ACP methyl ester carboxylesterase